MVIGSGGAALVGVIIVMAEKRRGDSVSPTNEDLVKINPAFSCPPKNTPPKNQQMATRKDTIDVRTIRKGHFIKKSTRK